MRSICSDGAKVGANFEHGAGEKVIKDILGHSSLATTQHYLTTRHPLRSREVELREMYRRLRNKKFELNEM